MNCTSTARNLSAYKHDQIQNITGNVAYIAAQAVPTPAGAFTFTETSSPTTSSGGSYCFGTVGFDSSRSVRAGNETTPLSTSYVPRLHF